MRKLYIIKAGSTFPDTGKQFGDFDAWTKRGLGETRIEIRTVDVERGDPLPSPERCAGTVITGSHSMVTDALPWSIALEKWIKILLKLHIPIFGICYGHQLLAKAAGGKVDFHPQGMEIGTVKIRLCPGYKDDPLFKTLEPSFPVHVTHAQTVMKLPESAVLLAENTFEPHHAFRIGDRAWGVQFHPEYNVDIMESYIREQVPDLASTGIDTNRLLAGVRPTPAAAKTLENFGAVVDHLELFEKRKDGRPANEI